MNKVYILFICILAVFFSGCGKEKSLAVKKSHKEKPAITEERLEQEPDVNAEDDQIAQKPEAEESDERKNPFLPREEESFLKSQEGKLTITYLRLSAIFYSPPSSKAIIDGKVFKEGDLIDNKEIVKINPEDVILKDTKGEYIISIKNVLGRDS